MTIVVARKKPVDPNAEIMTVYDLAALLRVSVSTLYRAAKAGNLPAFKIGRDYRFTRVQVNAWMKEQAKISKTAVYNPPRVKR